MCLRPFSSLKDASLDPVLFRRYLLSTEFSSFIANMILDLHHDKRQLLWTNPHNDPVDWLPDIPPELELLCMREFWQSSKYAIPNECAVCSHAHEGVSLTDIPGKQAELAAINFEILSV